MKDSGCTGALWEGDLLDFARNLAPNIRNAMGTGTSANATKPRSVPAQLMPMPLNICVANIGNPAAIKDLRKVFAAMAEAALWVKAVSQVGVLFVAEQSSQSDLQHEIL